MGGPCALPDVLGRAFLFPPLVCCPRWWFWGFGGRSCRSVATLELSARFCSKYFVLTAVSKSKSLVGLMSIMMLMCRNVDLTHQLMDKTCFQNSPCFGGHARGPKRPPTPPTWQKLCRQAWIDRSTNSGGPIGLRDFYIELLLFLELFVPLCTCLFIIPLGECRVCSLLLYTKIRCSRRHSFATHYQMGGSEPQAQCRLCEHLGWRNGTSSWVSNGYVKKPPC